MAAAKTGRERETDGKTKRLVGGSVKTREESKSEQEAERPGEEGGEGGGL